MTTPARADTPIPAAEANRSFSRLLREVQAGQSFVVTSHGRPVARLIPLADDEAEKTRRAAAHKALMDRLSHQPALDPPIGKFDREELWDEMEAEPFRPDWLQE